MNFNFIRLFQILVSYVRIPIRQRKRSQLRKMMRGYRYLKLTNKLHIVEDAIHNLRESSLNIPNYKFSTTLFGNSLHSSELISRQILSAQLVALGPALLIYFASPLRLVSAPIPMQWCVELENLGFRIDHNKCKIYWAISLTKTLIIGLARAIVFLIEDLSNWHLLTRTMQPYIYFCDLTRSNLPVDSNDIESCCFINWYTQWEGRNLKILALCHGVSTHKIIANRCYNLTFQKNPIPPLFNLSQKLLYIWWLFRAIWCLFYSSLSGRWWNIIIFSEAILAARVRIQLPQLLAKEYWFHNSRFYPPLWTYELPVNYSKSIFYFYSSNIEPFRRADGTRPFITPYSIMNWPNYLIWDRKMLPFIQKTQSDIQSVQISGPVNFSDNNTIYTPLKKFTFAVFDVTPFRSSIYQSFASSQHYYVPEVVIKFLFQIIEISVELDVLIALKRKRRIHQLAHPSYINYIKQLENCPNVIVLEPDISPLRVIKRSIGCITIPFTSTAVIAHNEGIPSAYFDPIAYFGVDDINTRGIALFNNKQSLTEWMKALLVSRT